MINMSSLKKEYIEKVRGIKYILEKMGQDSLLQTEKLDNVLEEMDTEAANLQSL